MLYVAWVMLHRNHIFGAGKSIEIRLRMCGPRLYFSESLFGGGAGERARICEIVAHKVAVKPLRME